MQNIRPRLGRRALLAAGASLAATGCWGSFNLTGKVYDWNGKFDSKWVSWLIFLAFIILPVYGTLLFIDALIINTIEFYSGNNPVQRSADLGDGNNLVLTPTDTEGLVHVEHRRHGRVVRSFYVEKTGDTEMRLLDAKGRQIARVGSLAGGRVRLRDGRGRRVAELEASQRRRVAEAAMRGDPIAPTLLDELHANGEANSVLAMAGDAGFGAHV